LLESTDLCFLASALVAQACATLSLSKFVGFWFLQAYWFLQACKNQKPKTLNLD